MVVAVLRKVKKDRYSVIPNAILNNESLSFMAKGIIAYYLSKPDGWAMSNAHLEMVSPTEGEISIAKAVNQLIEAGYYKRERWQDAGGHWNTTVYLTETPWDFDEEVVQMNTAEAEALERDENAQVGPTPGFQGLGELGLGNPGGNRLSTGEVSTKRASSAERHDDESEEPHRIQPAARRERKVRPGRRIVATAEDGPGESRMVGVSTRTHTATKERERKEIQRNPTSPPGLAAEFDRRAREAGLAGPQELNAGAMARNFRRWLDEGDTAAGIQEMFDKFFEATTEAPHGKTLWLHFINTGPKLRYAGAKPAGIDYAAAEARGHEILVRDAMNGDIRAQKTLTRNDAPWMRKDLPVNEPYDVKDARERREWEEYKQEHGLA